MSIAAPAPIVLPFATDGDRNVIPVESQIPILAGAASYQDGFPPLTMTPISSGGVPPAGKDMNGILFALSAYCAWLQGGGQFQYDTDFSDANTGYGVGAVLQSSVDPYRFWINFDADNVLDPDDDNTGWMSTVPLYAAVPLAAGQHDNVALPGPSDYVIDYTIAGAADITGFIAQRDGQRLFLSNVTAALLLQFLANNAGSDPENQIRGPSDLAVVENQTLTLQYSAGAAKWLLV